jgi:phosphoribosylanthranilate isomerase
MKPKVKICGITNIEDALQSVQSGADALGFVFYKKSKRYIKPVNARKIIQSLPPWVIKVGLFVNDKISNIKKVADYCCLDFIQLHGDEDSSYLKKLSNFNIIRAVRLKDGPNIKNLNSLNCTIVLFDSYSPEFGGAGRKFNWDLSKEIKKIRKPYMISGGLTPLNVSKAVKLFSPFAVDVSSGVEIKPGKKDRILIKEFIKNAKK